MIQLNHNPRLFVDEMLNQGANFCLTKSQTHYVLNVMRLNVGDGILLFNGRDGEWVGLLETVDKKACLVVVKDQVRVQTVEPGPWLAFAPIKKLRTNFIIEKATELGVQHLCPVSTQNTNSIRIKSARMNMHAIEASEQCRRLTVPKIAQPKSLEEFLNWWPKGRRLFVLDESGAGQPIVKALEDLRLRSSGLFKDCGFLIGPEGGFAATELEVFGKLDFVVSLDLGPHILRAETAALSAMACWQAFVGSND